MKNRSALPSLLPLLLLTSCLQLKTEVYRDSNVIARQKQAPFYPFNVHGGTTTYLQVAGKTYKGVRGLKPYHLDLPQIRSILFVTEKGRFSGITFHIVNIETRSHIAIDGSGSDFGRYIGYEPRAGQTFEDRLVEVSPDRVILNSRDNGWEEKDTLNLASKRLEHREIFIRGRDGTLKEHRLYIDGKRAE